MPLSRADRPASPEWEPTAEGSVGAAPGAQDQPTAIKMVVSGGPTVGKTTFLRSLSDVELASVRLDAAGLGGAAGWGATPGASAARSAAGVGDGDGVTTVFGRMSLPDDVLLYLFEVPGVEAAAAWDDLAEGAIGAVILVDTDRLDECFGAIDGCETRGVPFVVAVNCFQGVARHPLDSVRQALAMPPEVPMFYIDARSRAAAKQAVAALVELAGDRLVG